MKWFQRLMISKVKFINFEAISTTLTALITGQ